MTTLHERRLAEFVDREDELRRFCALLEDTDKRIMVICGDSGLGKSSLLARMTHECAARRIRKAEVVWTDTRPHDYLAVMRKIRDDTQPGAFSSFTRLVNHYYGRENYQVTLRIDGPAGGRVAEGARISDSTVGDVANVIVKDCMFNVPRPEIAVSESDRKAELTDEFVGALNAVLAQSPLVLFLDAAEKMSLDTEKWLWTELLTPLRDAALRSLSVVICGQRRPELDREWELCVDVSEMQPLGHEHIVEYLGKRGVAPEHRSVLADMLLAQTKGKVSEIAKAVDAFLKLQAKRAGAA